MRFRRRGERARRGGLADQGVVREGAGGEAAREPMADAGRERVAAVDAADPAMARGPVRGPQPTHERRSMREPGEPLPRRRALAWRSRDAGAAAVGTAGAGAILLARLVMSIAALIALLIALAIVLADVDANGANTLVKGIHEGANFFAGAFTGLIRFNGHPKRAITVDWGIALVVYLIVGAVLSGIVARAGRGGVGFERSHRTVPSH